VERRLTLPGLTSSGAKLETPSTPTVSTVKSYAIKAGIILLVACAIFGAGYFTATRVSGGTVELRERYSAAVSNLAEARSAEREIGARLIGMSNELESRQVAIGDLRARVTDAIATIERIERANRITGTIQSNIAGRIDRALDTATESGELISEFGRIVGSLQEKSRSGN
jgi:HAMP domain-containing protein